MFIEYVTPYEVKKRKVVNWKAVENIKAMRVMKRIFFFHRTEKRKKIKKRGKQNQLDN